MGKWLVIIIAVVAGYAIAKTGIAQKIGLP